MSEEITLSVEKRDILGKKVKQIRASGSIPAVIHNHGNESVHIKVDEKLLRKAYSEAGKNHPVSVKVGSKDYYVLIKDFVYAPASHLVQHAVFQAVRADEKTIAEVPVHLVGDSPAEKVARGNYRVPAGHRAGRRRYGRDGRQGPLHAWRDRVCPATVRFGRGTVPPRGLRFFAQAMAGQGAIRDGPLFHGTQAESQGRRLLPKSGRPIQRLPGSRTRRPVD